MARAAAGRPFLTLGLLLALALAGGALALSLKPNAGSDTFVSPPLQSYRATADDQRHFGSDAVVILVQEKLTDLVGTQDLTTISRAGGVSGRPGAGRQLPARVTDPPAKAGSKPAYGGNASAVRAADEAPARAGGLRARHVPQPRRGRGQRPGARVRGQRADRRSPTPQNRAYKLATSRGLGKSQAEKAATSAGTLQRQQELQQLEQLYLQSGISGMPSINDPQFIPEIVFDQTRGVDQPKARFAYLFPNSGSALIQVRLKASLSDAQQRQAIGWIRQAVGMPMFHLANGGTYTVSGVPVVTNDLASDITGSISKLLIAALLVMAAVLLIVFRSRLRLLPLAIALAAVGITFGVTSLAGASLTLASIAVLPILIGLGVDYAIQFQSRVRRRAARQPAGTGGIVDAVAQRGGHGRADDRHRGAGHRRPASWCCCCRRCRWCAGSGCCWSWGSRSRSRARCSRARRRSASPAAAAVRSARRSAARGRSCGDAAAAARPHATRRRSKPPRLPGRRLLSGVVSHPGRVLAVGIVLAAAGWVADTQTAVAVRRDQVRARRTCRRCRTCARSSG